MLDVLGSEYIRTAAAKGLAARIVVLMHALRNALIPVVTVVGLQIGILLGRHGLRQLGGVEIRVQVVRHGGDGAAGGALQGGIRAP